MKLRRIGASLAAVTAFGLLAAGCSSGSSSPGASSSSSGHVTLTYWNGFTGPDEPAVKALVAQFNQTHPDITIQMSIMPWDVFYEKLLPAFAAGNGPDIVAMDTQQLPQYATKNVFAPLTSYYGNSANDTSRREPECPALAAWAAPSRQPNLVIPGVHAAGGRGPHAARRRCTGGGGGAAVDDAGPLVGIKLVTAAGLALVAAGLWQISGSSATWTYADVLPGLILTGVT